jgi:hypothetical protein
MDLVEVAHADRIYAFMRPYGADRGVGAAFGRLRR